MSAETLAELERLRCAYYQGNPPLTPQPQTDEQMLAMERVAISIRHGFPVLPRDLQEAGLPEEWAAKPEIVVKAVSAVNLPFRQRVTPAANLK